MKLLLFTILFLFPIITFSQNDSINQVIDSIPPKPTFKPVEHETVEAPALSKKEKDSLFNAYQIEEVGIISQEEEAIVVNTEQSSLIGWIEISPEFPGGPVAMKNFIDSSFVYPPNECVDIRGTIYVDFVIDTLGQLDSFKVLEGLSPMIDREALRVVSSFPNFTPYIFAGEKRITHYTVPIKVSKYKENAMSPNPIHIYDACESNAEFFGGEKAMESFIKQNLKYPKEAQKKHQEGTVYVEFTVLKNGKLADIVILKGVSPSLNKEAIRLIKMMPNWIAYERSGVLYESSYILPILFQLK